MSNLLPPEMQRAMWRGTLAHFVFVFSCMLIALAAVLVLALVPGYLASDLAAPESYAASAEGRSDSAAETAALARAQLIASQLVPLYAASTSPSPVIDMLVRGRPKGVRIERISIEPGVLSEGGAPPAQGKAVLSGSASRESMGEFRALLADNPLLSDVSVPVGVLAGVAGGRFSVTVRGSF